MLLPRLSIYERSLPDTIPSKEYSVLLAVVAMAATTPRRRVLSDLSVNKYGTPPTMNMNGMGHATLKRHIREVDMPEYPQQASRVRFSPVSLVNSIDINATSATKVISSRSYTQGHTDKVTQMQVSILSNTVAVATSGPRDIPTLRVPDTVEVYEDEDSQNSFKDSISSFVESDPDETIASQQTAATELTQPLPSRAQHVSLKALPHMTSGLLGKHAETLRLRLRLAHFKVRTNQTDIPLSRLRLSSTLCQDRSPSPASSSTGQPLLPKLLPAPVLIPTAYSARTINIPRQDVTSSNPISVENSPYEGGDGNVFRTPALPRQNICTANQQQGNPGGRQIRVGRYEEEDHAMNSAVRGKAAIGLLGLRHER